jgi:hypothetical protein
VEPGVIELLLGALVRPKSVPLPVRFAVWAPPAELSLTVSVPLRVPEAVAVKVMLMLQLAPVASAVEQLLVCAKSPVVWIVPTLNAAFPLLVRVTAWDALDVPIC